eukprot:Gb_32296 [translate_table: standard]
MRPGTSQAHSPSNPTNWWKSRTTIAAYE